MKANIYNPDLQDRGSPEGFKVLDADIGIEAGSEHIGASLYEIPPGETSFPYHAHLANEEMLIVISGRPSLRAPDGWRELDEGDVVSFPRGLAGAHQLLNRTDEPVRVLMLSELRAPEVALYLDSGKILAREQPPGRPATGYRKLFRGADEVEYWEGEKPPEPPN